jgi:hypothetical protein
LGGVYGLAVTDRGIAPCSTASGRRAAASRSAAYFTAPASGGDELRRRPARIGATGTARLRPNGTLVPRNDFVGKPVHRARMSRFQQSLKFGRRRSADLIAEVFNLFNRANYGSYTLQESSPRYGQPNASSNLAYAPRTLQLGFRLTF